MDTIALKSDSASVAKRIETNGDQGSLVQCFMTSIRKGKENIPLWDVTKNFLA